MSDAMPLGDGSLCAQCGAAVTEKVIELGETRREGILTWKTPDTLGANLPCGHDAPALVIFDAPFITFTCMKCGCEMPDHAIYREYHAEHCPGSVA